MKKIFILFLVIFACSFGQESLAATETIRIYPTDDGRNFMNDDDMQSDWDLARSFSGSLDSGPHMEQDFLPHVSHKNPANGYWRIYRSSMLFDTSVIPDNVVIDSVSLSVYKAEQNNGGDAELVLTKHTRSSSTSLSKEDWQITNYGDELARGKLFDDQYTNYDFNLSGVQYINTEGYTIIGGLTSYDYDGIESVGIQGVAFNSSEALGTSTDPYLEITYTIPDEPEEEEVDPLVLQYVPRLFMHEDELYDPMNVEAFIDVSALWSGVGSGEQILDADALDLSALEDIIEDGEDTSDYYMSFSDPEGGSIDLENAKTVYEQLVATGATTENMYYHKIDATARDGREFIVLQYWFFYAMNNWKENGGVNNHEGDWESVFVFLDADTQEPAYAAFSSHLNDGDVTFYDGQYASVLRRWNNSLEIDGDRVSAFVALGSHANYPTNKRRIVGDDTSDNGKVITNPVLESIDGQAWSEYAGLWGTKVGRRGFDGPEGPKFIDVTSQNRFSDPLDWAGVNDTTSFIAKSEERLFEATELHASIEFETPLEVGTQLTIDLHKEIIRFGKNINDGIKMLPNFWDVITDAANGTFNATLRLSYDPEQVAMLGGNERRLGIYYYNESNDEWELQQTEVDTENHTVSATVDHFSWYAIGFTEEEELSTEDIFDRLRELAQESSLHRILKRKLVAFINHLERVFEKSDKRSLFAKGQLLKITESLLERPWYARHFSDDEKHEITELFGILESRIETKARPSKKPKK